MSVIDQAKSLIQNKRIPYNYIMGQKSTSSLPFDVKLSIDKDFNKAVTKWVTIGTVGLSLGIFAGILISKNISKNRK